MKYSSRFVEIVFDWWGPLIGLIDFAPGSALVWFFDFKSLTICLSVSIISILGLSSSKGALASSVDKYASALSNFSEFLNKKIRLFTGKHY